MTETPAPRRRVAALGIAIAAIVVLLLAGGAAWWASVPQASPGTSPSAPSTFSAPPSPTPTPTPSPIGFPANTSTYALEALPAVDVFALVPALPVDPDPHGALTGEVVRAVSGSVPVFADPTGEPVASLPRDHRFDGTTVPVIERQDHWVRVLLTGRAARPSAGNPGQLTGWVRAQDVEFAATDATIEVDLAARTVDIAHRDGTRERVADDFGSGTSATPTPTGRSFVMMTRVEPSFGYTRGHPLVYLSVQSPTLDGFGGADAAVTAFHYHDARSGAISNGCIRLGPEAIDRLAQMPIGTPVYIR